jgi:V8-like Glu-specific endopeptidase
MKYMAVVLLLVAAMSAQNAPSTNKGARLDIPAISREAHGAVVSIVVSDKNGHPVAQGSGFLISKDGQVVTNYHVIKNGSSALVKLPNGTFFAVDGVLASDKNRDLAIIKAHGVDFHTLTLGDSDRLEVGEEVVAIGNPLSLESTVSNGIVSAIPTVEDEGGKFLQITAPISPGSSGGPLFNMSGKVVGITTSHLVGGQNLNFAIPIDDVKSLTLVPRLAEARAFPDEAEDEKPTAVASATLAQQKMCAEQAQKKFNEAPEYTPFGAVGRYYVSHYDASTNVCYMMIHVTISRASGWMDDFRVTDAFERRDYADFSGPLGEKPNECFVTGHGARSCESKYEFLDLVDKCFGIRQ